MRTIEINIYKFQELTTEIKAKVLKDLEDINITDSWHVDIYEEAESIGFELKDFDLKRSIVTSNKLLSIKDVLLNIVNRNQKDSEIFDLALITYNKLVGFAFCSHSFREVEDAFFNSLATIYYNQLKTVWDILISDSQIIEAINFEEFDFTIKGEIVEASN